MVKKVLYQLIATLDYFEEEEKQTFAMVSDGKNAMDRFEEMVEYCTKSSNKKKGNWAIIFYHSEKI